MKKYYIIILLLIITISFKNTHYEIHNEIKRESESVGEVDTSYGTGMCSYNYLEYYVQTGFNEARAICGGPGRYNLRLNLVEKKYNDLNNVGANSLASDVYGFPKDSPQYYIDIFPPAYHPNNIADDIYNSLTYNEDSINGIRTGNNKNKAYYVETSDNAIKEGINNLFGKLKNEENGIKTKQQYLDFASKNYDNLKTYNFYIYFENSTKAKPIYSYPSMDSVTNKLGKLFRYILPSESERNELRENERYEYNAYSSENENKMVIYNERKILENNEIFNDFYEIKTNSGEKIDDIKDYIKNYNNLSNKRLLSKNIMQYIAKDIVTDNDMKGEIAISSKSIYGGREYTDGDDLKKYGDGFVNMTKEQQLDFIKNGKTLNDVNILDKLLEGNGISKSDFNSNTNYYVLTENKIMVEYYYYVRSENILYRFFAYGSYADLYGYVAVELIGGGYEERFSSFNSLYLNNKNKCDTQAAIEGYNAMGKHLPGFYCNPSDGNSYDAASCTGAFSFYNQSNNLCFLELVAARNMQQIKDARNNPECYNATASSDALSYDGKETGAAKARQCIFDDLYKNKSVDISAFGGFTNTSIYDALDAIVRRGPDLSKLSTNLIKNAGYGVNMLREELFDEEKELVFRIIDTTKPFPGASGKNTRERGSNWSDETVVEKYITNANDSYGSKGKAKYSIMLTPSDIKEIKNNGYTYGDDKGASEFINFLSTSNKLSHNLATAD